VTGERPGWGEDAGIADALEGWGRLPSPTDGLRLPSLDGSPVAVVAGLAVAGLVVVGAVLAAAVGAAVELDRRRAVASASPSFN
jgi:hypothetical protein